MKSQIFIFSKFYYKVPGTISMMDVDMVIGTRYRYLHLVNKRL